MLVGMTDSSGLGTPERLKTLESLKQRRTEPGKTVISIQQYCANQLALSLPFPFPSPILKKDSGSY